MNCFSMILAQARRLRQRGLNHSNIVAWKDAISQSERDRIKQTIEDYINEHKNQSCE